MKIDARTRYTRKVIREAFLEFLKEKPITKITVKEVCDRAEVNRGTFYKHYKDCYDLMDQVEENALEQFGQMMASIKTDGIRPVLVTILEALRNNRDIIRIMADPTRERSFIYRLAACCLDYMELWMSASIDPEQAGEDQSIEFAFLAGGCSGAVEYWIHNGMKEPPEEIARRIEEFIGTMIGSRMEKSQ